MYRILTVLLLLAHSDAQCSDEITESPRKAFKIVQQYREPQGQEIGGHWEQTLHFAKGGPGVVLEHDMMWPARYEISPDERWVLRIQKSGSGDNISFLYRIDESRRVWRIEEQIGELAFAFLARSGGAAPQDLYHTGIEFTSWDMKSGLLHFTVRGSSMNENGKGVERALSYKLDKHVIVPQ